jgi:pimeloyl-ACP methyl ester carboxylesterase
MDTHRLDTERLGTEQPDEERPPRLSADVRGDGAPVVVFEAGSWDIGLTWSPVQDRVSATTQTVSYDRAGLGRSEASYEPRTPGQMVAELRRLLATVEAPPPYVLVGHSFGALVVRLFAHLFPDEVAGLVLVDGAHEDQVDRFPEPIQEAMSAMEAQAPATLDGLRTLLGSGPDPAAVPVPSGLPPEVRTAYAELLIANPSAVDGIAAETHWLERSRVEVRTADIRSLGDLPVVVIRHGVPQPVPGLSDEVNAAYEEAWVAVQADLAGQSSRGRVVVAEGAGHDVHHEAPDLVAEQVIAVVEEVRSRR